MRGTPVVNQVAQMDEVARNRCMNATLHCARRSAVFRGLRADRSRMALCPEESILTSEIGLTARQELYGPSMLLPPLTVQRREVVISLEGMPHQFRSETMLNGRAGFLAF